MSWKQTIGIERNRKIFEEELRDFLPDRILDFHVHVFSGADLPPGIEYAIDAGGNRIREYTVEELARDYDALFPGRSCKAVCFGVPFPHLPTDANNAYVAGACDGKRFFPLRLLRPEENPDDVERDVLENGFYGFKPYRDYAGKTDPEETEILDFLPEKHVEIADRHGLVIMLHIPKKARLADPSNQEQVAHLCTTYPRAKIVLAHAGRAYYLRGITGNLDRLRKLKNCYFDIAMVQNPEVLEYLFRTIESRRILFGTDIPIALAAGKAVEINDQYTYVTPIPWHLSISDDHEKLVFTSFAYEEIRAVRKAVARIREKESFVEDIFHRSGHNLLSTVETGKKS